MGPSTCILRKDISIASKVERTPHILMCFFLLLHMLFEPLHTFLQVAVDLQVPLYYPFHSVHVLVHVVLLVAEALQIADQLALFCQQLRCLLQVFEMLVPELFLLLDQLVGFLVERQQVGVELVAALSLASAVHHVV